MPFRFNFSGVDCDDPEKAPDTKEIIWLESEEIIPNNQIKLDDMVSHAKMITCGDVQIGHIVVNEALANMADNGAPNASKLAKDENSDLVTGKYEGGLKIWECTHDLLKYIIENEEEAQLEEYKVLDLGCGAGILGIYTFLNGSMVTFQDYNREVLEYVTIPNVLLNIEEDEDRNHEIKRCNFFSGDWASFDERLGERVFDLILSSETIYNETNYDKLIQILIKRLSQNGKAYIAAKTCYFGVGGGVRLFESFIDKNDSLKCEVCWKTSDGIQREILKITKK